MKKRKLLFLLTAVFALSVPLSACDNGESSSSSTEKEKHAMATHFVVNNEKAAYSTVESYQGTLESVNEEHGLAVLRTTEYTKNDAVYETVTVLDMASGNEIWSESVTNSTNASSRTHVSVDVETYYPLMEITETTYSIGQQKKDYTYRFAKQYGTKLISDAEEQMDINRLESMCICEIKDKVYWIGENMETIRTFNKIQTDDYILPGFNINYNIPDFDASYKDYLYAFEFSDTTRVIEVYNREGVCSMQYTYPSDVGMVGYNQSGPVVLNNGNILVQELTLAEEDATDYDFKIPQESQSGEAWAFDEKKVYMTSKIIDYKTGEVTTVDLDFVIFDLESAYARDEETSFPFTLQAGEENQAYIAKIINHDLAPVEYVTMDNNGSVTYRLQNEYLKTEAYLAMGMNGYSSIAPFGDDYYVAYCASNPSGNNTREMWLFDFDGNKVAYIPDSVEDVTDKYIVTEYGIYDYTNTLVYDFETSPFFTETHRGPMAANVEMIVNKNTIMLQYVNVETMKNEWYIFDGTDFVKQELSGSVEIDADMLCNGGRLPAGNKVTINVVGDDALTDSFNSTTPNSTTWTLHKEDGEPLLRMTVDSLNDDIITVLDEVAYLTTEIDGKDYLYVLK